MTQWSVLKFGGSSVGRPERLVHVVGTIKQAQQSGPLAVVVSAMGDSTDWLIEAVNLAAAGQLSEAEAIVNRMGDLAVSNAMVVLRQVEDASAMAQGMATVQREVRDLLGPLSQMLLGVSLLRQKTPQSFDLCMSFGERLSAMVVTRVLECLGVKAHFLDARTWTRTDDTFGQAVVDWPASLERLGALRTQWPEGAVPVCTGFLGQTEEGLTTTLGRNGSDYTATLLARGLGAREVMICTDVSGVMTADPRIVRDAYPVEKLTYLEALELANYGAKMFHPRTMLPLIESGIPMRIRNTLNPEDPGTLIAAQKEGAEAGPVCVTSLEHLSLIDVRWRQLGQQAEMGQRVLQALTQAKVTVWMATQAAHGQAVSVVVPGAQLERARGAIGQELAKERGSQEVSTIEVQETVTLLSLVAQKMQQERDAAGRLLHALGGIGVGVLAIGQGYSSRSISCVIDAHDTELAVRTVHAAFNFSHQQIHLLVLGVGVVGTQLLAQIQSQRELLRLRHDIDVRVAGVANRRGVVFDPHGVDLGGARGLLEAGGEQVEQHEGQGFGRILSQLSQLAVPVVIDCTSGEEMEAVYEQAFAHGVHVVAANKKPLTTSYARYDSLMRCARQHSRAYHYETTVGASLPVIETLKNLVRTGDQVLRIEGAFSGTLGYLTNEVMGGVPLSEAVRTAKALGYTEPQPQDDLSGLDVARKALILARELGLELELAEVSVEPLVESRLLVERDVGRFLEALEAQDEAFSQRIERMREKGQMLRYLAIVDPGGKTGRPQVKVGPVVVEADHPSTRLRGSESFVAFTTKRYQDYPLLVQGAGAGGAVTAAGVLADVLKIAQTVRGR